MDATSPLTPKELARLALYRAVIRLTRLVGGRVDVAVVTSTSNLDPNPNPETKAEADEVPIAVACFFPPNTRPTMYSEFRAGLYAAARQFGYLVGVPRILWFQNVRSSLYTCLGETGEKQVEGAYVEIVGVDPEYRGAGFGGRLLEWTVQEYSAGFTSRDGDGDEGAGVKGRVVPPVYLETATPYAVRLYEKLGFRVLAEKAMEIEVDAQGLKRSGREEWERGEHRFRMMRLEFEQ